MSAKRLLRGVAFFTVLVALGYAWQAMHLGINEAWIDNAVRGHGWSGELLFLASAALATAVGVPRQIPSFLGGYAFGFTLGTTWSLTATCLGCVLSFYSARWLAADTVRGRLRGRLHRMNEHLGQHSFVTALVIRMFPVGNNLVTNLVAGVSNARPLPFFAGSAFGYAPQTVVFALTGSGVGIGQGAHVAMGAVLFVVSAVLGTWLYRSYGATHDIGEADTHTVNP